MKMLLKNGTLIDYKTNTFDKFDILIQEEKIVKIAIFPIDFLAKAYIIISVSIATTL